MNISIVGGDLRIVKLAEELSIDGYSIFTFGLPKITDKISLESSLEDCINRSDIILSSIPLSLDRIMVNAPFCDNPILISDLKKLLLGKKFLAGAIYKEFYDSLEGTIVVDLLQDETLTVLNVIPSAEGAIQVAMQETQKTLNGSNILILGFGRIGKVLANMLQGFGARVDCEARKDVDLAWIRALGYTQVAFQDLNKKINEYDIIFNTIPSLIIDEEKLKLLKKDCVIVDVASNPGGVDRTKAQELGIKVKWALALPGKVAPKTSAKYIKERLVNIL